MTNSKDGVKLVQVEITETQLKFLKHCEEFNYGKLEVDIKEGQPVGYFPVVRDGLLQHYTKCN